MSFFYNSNFKKDLSRLTGINKGRMVKEPNQLRSSSLGQESIICSSLGPLIFFASAMRHGSPLCSLVLIRQMRVNFTKRNMLFADDARQSRNALLKDINWGFNVQWPNKCSGQTRNEAIRMV